MTERFAQIRYDELPPEVRPLADDILKVSSAALGGPYNALLRSPDMARRAFDFLDYLRFKTSGTVPSVKGGKIKAYASAGKARLPQLPEVPAISDAGV